MTDIAPDITVAVSTKNRAKRLPRLLSALERQTIDPRRFEVVIVDNGSDDDSISVLASLAAQTEISLRHLRLDGKAGPAVGRNAAWRAASADIVAFTDDDCYPLPQWLAIGLTAMGSADVVVGKTMPDPDQLNKLGPFSRTVRVDDARFFQTCNVFFRRADLEAVGGFDEAFPTPAGEDTDLGLRVAALGRDVAFAQDAVVYHDVSPSRFRDALRVTRRWAALARVIAKHPVEGRKLLHHRIFWKDSHPRVILASIGIAGAWRWPATLLLALPWAYFRIKRRPLTHDRIRRFLVLPGAFAIDALEVAVMVAGSIKHRAIIL